jgi:hypothetical protein
MATKKVNVNGNVWTAITTNGQSGSCWLNTNIIGGGAVMVDHSTVSGINCSFDKAYPLYREYGVKLNFTADVLSDIYYAKCTNPTSTVILSVDAY